MIIVGLTGYIGSGKTTFANFLGIEFSKHKHLESSDLIIEVVNEWRTKTKQYPDETDLQAMNTWLALLPPIIKAHTRVQILPEALQLDTARLHDSPELYTRLLEYLTLFKAHPELAQGDITIENKSFHRPILQWVGGFMAKCTDDKIWYRELLLRAHENEAVELVTISGLRFPADAACVRESGGVIIGITRSSHGVQDPDDLTEKERSLIKPDSYVYNNANLGQLKACARQISHDLKRGVLKTDYATSDFR